MARIAKRRCSACQRMVSVDRLAMHQWTCPGRVPADRKESAPTPCSASQAQRKPRSRTGNEPTARTVRSDSTAGGGRVKPAETRRSPKSSERAGKRPHKERKRHYVRTVEFVQCPTCHHSIPVASLADHVSARHPARQGTNRRDQPPAETPRPNRSHPARSAQGLTKAQKETATRKHTNATGMAIFASRNYKSPHSGDWELVMDVEGEIPKLNRTVYLLLKRFKHVRVFRGTRCIADHSSSPPPPDKSVVTPPRSPRVTFVQGGLPGSNRRH